MLNNINISFGRQKFIVYVVLAVVTLAVYWRVNQYGFVNFEDISYVTENSHIQSGITLDGVRWAFSTRYYDLWNPLVWLSLMFDYQLHGLNAGGYHLSNLILHILSVLLLFWLFYRMTGAIWKSTFVAILFALHPLHVESVAWITERKDVLSAFFWMLTLCLYVYYTEKPVIRRYLLVIFSFVLALMSKPMVVTVPIVMILLDYWPLNRLQSRKIETKTEVMPVATNKGKKKKKSKKETLIKKISSSHVQKLSEPKIEGIIPLWQLLEKIPFFILSAVLAVITLYNPNTPDMSATPDVKQFPLLSLLANAPVSFVTYLEKTFWPHDMAVFYPFTEQIPLWQIWGATFLIIIVSIVVVIMVKRLPYLFVGWLWYTITIAPVIGIIQISRTNPYIMADRYHYLPSIGITIMLAWGIPSLIKRENIRKKLLFPAATAFFIIMSVLTWQQCGYWKDSIELFSHALKVTKNNCLMHNNRGGTYGSLGQYQRAIEDFNEAIRINPNYADAYSNRGIAYLLWGNNNLGCRDVQKACELQKCGDLEVAKGKGLCH